MISREELVHIIGEIIPMYFVFIIAYISVKWWRIFTPEQTNGINRLLGNFVIPFLCFKVISSSNFYAFNFKFFAADFLHKIVSLPGLFLWKICSKKCSLEWIITFFALFSLSNTLIIGFPITIAMYGIESLDLVVQAGVLQLVIWTTVFLILLEYRSVKLFISEKLPNTKACSSIDNREFSKGSDFIGFSHMLPENKGVGDHIISLNSLDKIKPSLSFDIDDELTKNKDEKKLHMIELNSSIESTKTETTTQEHAGIDVGVDHNITLKDASFQKETCSREKEMEIASSSEMTKYIFYMVWKKISRNPTLFFSLLGVVWSLLSFKYHIKIPTTIYKCVSLLSDTGLALAMFTLGTFMAAQPSMIACSKWDALWAIAVRFLVSPAIMAATSKLVGLHGVALKAAIIQAVFPQATNAFVFAKEYNVNVNVFSTSNVIGMLIALPVILLYYLLMELF